MKGNMIWSSFQVSTSSHRSDERTSNLSHSISEKGISKADKTEGSMIRTSSSTPSLLLHNDHDPSCKAGNRDINQDKVKNCHSKSSRVQCQGRGGHPDWDPLASNRSTATLQAIVSSVFKAQTKAISPPFAMVNAGDHCSLRMSRQMLPLALMFGW